MGRARAVPFADGGLHGGEGRTGDAPGKSLALWAAARVDLDRFDCGACPEHRREGRGCHGGARGLGGAPAYFAGERYETDTCPRRHLIDHSDVVAAFVLYRACDGKPGLDAADKLTGPALSALAIISDGHAAKMKEDLANE